MKSVLLPVKLTRSEARDIRDRILDGVTEWESSHIAKRDIEGREWVNYFDRLMYFDDVSKSEEVYQYDWIEDRYEVQDYIVND